MGTILFINYIVDDIEIRFYSNETSLFSSLQSKCNQSQNQNTEPFCQFVISTLHKPETIHYVQTIQSNEYYRADGDKFFPRLMDFFLSFRAFFHFETRFSKKNL